MRNLYACLLVLLTHLCNVVLTASLPALILPDSAIVSVFKGAANGTLSSNLTFATMVNRVKDPYDFPIPLTTLTAEFYGYGAAFPIASAATNCISKAITDFRSHAFEAQVAIGMEKLTYSSEGLYLILYPGPHLTWFWWLEVIIAIMRFVQVQDMYVDFSFIIVKEGVEGDIGRGIFSAN